MDIDKKVLEKIAKLQALSASNHLGEVKAAEHQIKRLMDKHGISMEEITNFQVVDTEYIEKTESLNRQKIDQKYTTIASILQRYFFVSILWKRSNNVSIIFIGQKKDVEIASYLFDYLDKALEREWKVYKKDPACYDTSATARKSFFMGLRSGLDTKLEAERQQCQQWGLVIVDDKKVRDREMSKMYPDAVTRRRSSSYDNSSAYNGGRTAGGNMSLNMGIKGNGAKAMQLN